MSRSEELVRPATLDDASAIASLAAQLGYPAAVETIRHRLTAILASDRDVIRVAIHEGKVAGWIHAFLCQLIEADYRAEIGGLIVDASLQRRGIGRTLVASVKAWALQRGAVEVSVRCQTKRLEAHRFYESLGFQPIKTQLVLRCRPDPAP